MVAIINGACNKKAEWYACSRVGWGCVRTCTCIPACVHMRAQGNPEARQRGGAYGRVRAPCTTARPVNITYVRPGPEETVTIDAYASCSG
jgi:hypothetical protein